VERCRRKSKGRGRTRRKSKERGGVRGRRRRWRTKRRGGERRWGRRRGERKQVQCLEIPKEVKEDESGVCGICARAVRASQWLGCGCLAVQKMPIELQVAS